MIFDNAKIKRLERGTFQLLTTTNDREGIELNYTQLVKLLGGLDLRTGREAMIERRLAAYTTEGEPYLERLPERHMVIEVLTNRMPGGVTLSTRSPSVRGLELQFDRTELKSSESARLTVHFDPSAGKPPSFVRARIMVMPTQRLIPLTIQFAPKSPAGVPAK